MSLERRPYNSSRGPESDSDHAKDNIRSLQTFNEWANIFRIHFFSHQEEHLLGMPQPLVSIAPLRVDRLATHHIIPTPRGFEYELILNSKWSNRPVWETLETMLHELVHIYQENILGMEKPYPEYHNQRFVLLCESIGLHPRLGSGAHWKPADGPFAELLSRYGIKPPKHGIVVSQKEKKSYWWDADRGEKKGHSTLVLYTSEACQRTPPCKLRSGRSDLQLHCDTCGGVFKVTK